MKKDSTRTIAKRYGVSKSTVLRHCKDIIVGQISSIHILSDETINNIRKDYTESSIRAICKKYHIGKNRASEICQYLIQNKSIFHKPKHACPDCGKKLRLSSERCQDCRVKFIRDSEHYKLAHNPNKTQRIKKPKQLKPITVKKLTIKQPAKSINRKILEQLKADEIANRITPVVEIKSNSAPLGQWKSTSGKWGITYSYL
jgi:predicted RNA-binding Zn-ribbon protein involved in translation (DUF1610 family)